jgi:DNA helicase HerA-like ATPase
MFYNKAYREIGDDSGVDDLISRLAEMKEGGAERARTYVERLKYYRVIGKETTSIKDYLKPGTLIILDFSGVDDSILDIATRLVLEEIFHYKRRREYRYPVFLFIEEAHRVVPADRETHSSRIIKRIAREGRKFGVFLTIISQRPRSVDQDVLSMCQSFITLRIVNPEDQNIIRRSAEKMSEDLLENLPGLNVGEAVVVGDLVKIPVIMKFSGRRSDEGGRDIDVERELEEAVNEIRREIELNPRNLPRPEEVI